MAVGGDIRASYVGTIIGVILGVTALANTVLFANTTAVVDKIVANHSVAIAFLILILILSNAVLYKSIKKDLMSFECIAKRFPVKIKSRSFKTWDY